MATGRRRVRRGFAAGLAMLALACGGREDEASGRSEGRLRTGRAGGEVRVAVASNFAMTLRRLARAFEDRAGYPVSASAASTGKLYAQIRSGAPFDVFLAADADRPERLVREGLARAASLRRYASGRLVFIAHVAAIRSPDPHDAGPPEVGAAPEGGQRALPGCLRRILDPEGRTGRGMLRIAIANPATAPYGRAARETLRALGLWTALEPRIVRGENVSQAFQFVESGNAAAGLVARSQMLAYTGDRVSACRWSVPPDLHAPIEQKMVVLGMAFERPAVAAFEDFMKSELAKSMIRDSGYVP